MTTIKLPEVDVSRVRDALARIDVPGVQVTDGVAVIELPRIDLPSIDLSSIELPHIELPGIDLDIGRLTGRSRGRGLLGGFVLSTPVILGLAALLGGLAIGGGLAWLLHPTHGPARRRRLQRRLGMAPARPTRRAEGARAVVSIEPEPEPLPAAADAGSAVEAPDAVLG